MNTNNILVFGKHRQPASEPDLHTIMVRVGEHLDAVREEIRLRMRFEEDRRILGALGRFLRLLDKEEQNLLSGVTSLDELLG